jgi:prepilin-type processing-associated H-X9-DG protein
VIAIIAILAAILLPVFARARAQALATSCLNNEKQIGMALIMYANDYDQTFPMAYYYVNGEDSTAGYNDWTGLIMDYAKSQNVFSCPSSVMGGVHGWAPTDYTNPPVVDPPGTQTSLHAGIMDNQAYHKSYTVNELIMPRKKIFDPANPSYVNSAQLNCVQVGNLNHPSGMILVAEFTTNVNCLLDASAAGGTAIKTHRPTNGVRMNDGSVVDCDPSTGTFTSPPSLLTEAPGLPTDAATTGNAGTCWSEMNDAVTKSAAGHDHIVYMNPQAHDKGSNYIFADGHAKFLHFADTFNYLNYMWGDYGYSMVTKPPVLRADNGQQVGME